MNQGDFCVRFKRRRDGRLSCGFFRVVPRGGEWGKDLLGSVTIVNAQVGNLNARETFWREVRAKLDDYTPLMAEGVRERIERQIARQVAPPSEAELHEREVQETKHREFMARREAYRLERESLGWPPPEGLPVWKRSKKNCDTE